MGGLSYCYWRYLSACILETPETPMYMFVIVSQADNRKEKVTRR